VVRRRLRSWAGEVGSATGVGGDAEAGANTRPSSIVFPTVKALSTSSYLLTIDGLKDLLEVIPGFRCSLPLLGTSGNHSAIINNISNRIVTRTSIYVLSIDVNANGRNHTEQLPTVGFEITLIISMQSSHPIVIVDGVPLVIVVTVHLRRSSLTASGRQPCRIQRQGTKKRE
jgi:hypothetical protein